MLKYLSLIKSYIYSVYEEYVLTKKLNKRLERVKNSKSFFNSLQIKTHELEEPTMMCGPATKYYLYVPELKVEEKKSERKLTNTFLLKTREQKIEAKFVPNHSTVWFYVDKWNGYYEREISFVFVKKAKDKKGVPFNQVVFQESNGVEHLLQENTIVHVRGYQLQQEPTTWFYSDERE